MQETVPHDNHGGCPPPATRLQLNHHHHPHPPLSSKPGLQFIQRRGSFPTSIGSDSSFASSEASFTVSEASHASSRTSDSQHSSAQIGSIDAFDHAVSLHDFHVGDESFSHVYHDRDGQLDPNDVYDLHQLGNPPKFVADPSVLPDGLSDKSLNHPTHNFPSHHPSIPSSLNPPSSDRAPPHFWSAPAADGRAPPSSQNSPRPADLSEIKSSAHAATDAFDEHDESRPQNAVKTFPQTNPRRSAPNSARVPPPLVRQAARKVAYVEELMDITEQLVGFIWPGCSSPLTWQSRSGGRVKVPLRCFIKEILKRSRASHSTLQMAMYYCYLIWKSPRDMPDIDGRRMFLASLMLAFKYLQDRNYSAHAWSTISGLNSDEIMSTQTEFLWRIDYRLFLHVGEWDAWRGCIDKCVIEKRWGNPVVQWPQLLQEMKHNQAVNEALREQHRLKKASLSPMDWTDSVSPPTVVFEPLSAPPSAHLARPTTSVRRPQVLDQVIELPTPPSSPTMAAPRTPFISALSSPDDDETLAEQGEFVNDSTRPSPSKPLPAVQGFSAVLPERTKGTTLSIPISTTPTVDQVHEDGPGAPESTPDQSFGHATDQWYEDHRELIETAEDLAERKLAQRSAKGGHGGHGHSHGHGHHKGGIHSRKRSIARCLEKEGDLMREGRSNKSCCRAW